MRYNLFTCQGHKPDLCFKSTDQTATHNRISLCAECARYGFRLTLAGSLVSWRAHSAFKEFGVGKKPNWKCEICGKLFYSSPGERVKGWGRFCSKKCKGQAQNVKVECVCGNCGKTFLTFRAERERGYGKYCSSECARQARLNQRVHRVCAHCGKGFFVPPNVVASGRGLYCSRACYAKYKSVLMTGSGHHNWKGGDVLVACQHCGKEFPVPPGMAGVARFCSRECDGKRKIALYSGPGNPAWLGGLSFAPYPETFNRVFKRMIRVRDGYTCALCGSWGNEVHHINYQKEDTNPRNCITLCKHCHRKTNFNRPYWESLLAEMQQKRGIT